MIVADVPPTVTLNPQPVAHVARCETHACWHRVSRRRHIRWRWRWFHRHPMPSCTWVPESSTDPATGRSYFGRPWARGRYKVRNPHSTAGGKFQILYSTWLSHGGKPRGNAAYAAPFEQEEVARVVMNTSGISQWVNC